MIFWRVCVGLDHCLLYWLKGIVHWLNVKRDMGGGGCKMHCYRLLKVLLLPIVKGIVVVTDCLYHCCYRLLKVLLLLLPIA